MTDMTKLVNMEFKIPVINMRVFKGKQEPNEKIQ